MTIIIEGLNEAGNSRRCDARCYDGVGARCNCICGGSNHGVGLERAQAQTVDILQSGTLNMPDGHTVQMRLV